MNFEANFDRIKKRRETKRKRKIEIKLGFFSDIFQNGETESNWRLLKTELLVTYIEVSDSESRSGQRRRGRQWHVRTHCLFYRSNRSGERHFVSRVSHTQKQIRINLGHTLGVIERYWKERHGKKKTLINKQNLHTTRLWLSFECCISTFWLCLMFNRKANIYDVFVV